MVLALVIGRLVENSLRQSLTISQGSLTVFFTHPVAAVLIVFAFASIFHEQEGKLAHYGVDSYRKTHCCITCRRRNEEGRPTWNWPERGLNKKIEGMLTK
jgi:hypothetical protein